MPTTQQRPRAHVVELVLLGPDDVALADNARQHLVAKCMRDRGFEFAVAPFAGVYSLGSMEALLGEAPRSPDDAQADGFTNISHDRSVGDASAIARYNKAVDANLEQTRTNAAFAQALDPDDAPGTGCAERTVTSLNGDTASSFTTLQAQVENQLSELARTMVSSDAYARIETSWARCMAERGMPFASFRALAEERWPPPRPTERERAAAFADATCRQVEHLDSAIAALFDNLVNDWVEQHPSVIGDLETARSNLLGRCAEALQA